MKRSDQNKIKINLNNNTKISPQKRKLKFSIILKLTILLAAFALICVATIGIYLTKQAESALNKSHENLEGREFSNFRNAKVEPIKDNLSILFVGIDDSEGRGQGAQNSRSDALILATLNNKSKTIKMVSIPRDSYVYIPYKGFEDKITHAHAYGGTLASIETVEELFDIPIDYYVRMNFNAFVDTVNALDGVKAEVPYEIHEKDETGLKMITLEPGYQTLDGSEALALARTRKQDNDVMRGQRQQVILKALLKKATSVSSITKYDDVIQAVGDNMKTDLTFSDMKSLLAYFKSGTPSIDSLNLEGEDDMSTGTYYYKLDDESLSDVQHDLQRHLGINPNSTKALGSTSKSSIEETSSSNN